MFNRQEVKDIFDGVDVDRSGKLDRAEFGAVAARARKSLNLSPPFDPEADWALVHHVEVGCGRILVSETEVPNAFANLV